MKFLTEKRFSFVSSALAADSFGVVHFTGTEALSSLYEFDITLVTDDPALDLDAVLRQPATFTIHRPDEQPVDFNGILAHFEQLHQFNDCIFYRALLRPRLWWLTLTRHNQVCLNLPVVPPPQGAAQSSLIGQVLKDGGLSALDYTFRTQKTYAPLEYVCQYGESHYDFMARWLEREGLYYFFEQSASNEKLVITDSVLSHVDLPHEGKLLYAPPSGLDAQHHDEVIKMLTCRQKMLPQKVLLKDHNYERPTLEVTGTAEVDPKGRGEAYLYGDSFLTPEEGNRLAGIYAEALLCRKIEFFGESTVPFLMPGYTFALDRHYRRDFNRKYLVTEVRHEGNQTGYLISGLQGALSGIEQGVSYRNSFTAIPAPVQFRPERITRKPRIAGTLHATIDAEGSGQYAELDDQGRYKVRLPFDLNDAHQSGKASSYLRMAQPYAGPKRGMHFPLPKGTEVLLTFINGDPDRPIIAAAVPNPETPSPTTARNQTEAVLCTGGGSKIHMEDKIGSEGLLIQSGSPLQQSHIAIGMNPLYGGEWQKTNQNSTDKVEKADEENKNWVQDTYSSLCSENGLHLCSVGPWNINAKMKSETILGASSSTVYGVASTTVIADRSDQTVGLYTDMVLGSRTIAHCGTTTEFKGWKAALIPFYTTVRGKEGKIAMSSTELKETVTSLYTHHMELLGTVERLQAKLTEIQVDKNVMRGKISKLQGKVDSLEGENVTLRGQVSEMNGTVTKIQGESSTIVGKVQNLEGSVSNLRGDVTNVEGNLVRVSLSVAQVAASHSTM